MKFHGQFVGIALVVVVLIFLSKAVVVVPAGTVGIVDVLGNVRDGYIAAGVQIVNPLAQVHAMSIRTREITETANVPSREGLAVDLDISLLYSLTPAGAADVYKTIGLDYERVVVIPQMRSVVRGVTSDFDAEALYTSGREQISTQMFDQLSAQLKDRGVKVEKVLLRNAKLPEIVATAIQNKLKAKQESDQMQFVLTREKSEADRKKIEADGIAEYQKRIATGITPDFLRWYGVEATKELAKSQNAKIVVIGSGKDGLPLILGGNN